MWQASGGGEAGVGVGGHGQNQKSPSGGEQHVCFWILVLAGVIFVLMTVAGGFSMFVFVH